MTNKTSRRCAPSCRSSQKEKVLLRQQEVLHQKIILGCVIATVLILLFLIFALPKLTKNTGTLKGVNEDVLRYQSQVETWCHEFDIDEYATLMLAIMQQESSGQGTDVFQCSESPFNTWYSNEPNSITDIDYSIRVGAETFAYCLDVAGCESIRDTDLLKIAIQEYNFGNDYATWALSNFGEYSLENAAQYSQMMQERLGWTSYGDIEYVPHVLRYIDL